MAKAPAWNTEQAELLATKVKALIKTFNPRSMNSNFYQQTSQLSQQGPIGRAVTKIATILPPDDIASIEPGYRAVWSTNPTATQRPMPNGVSQIVDDFVAAQSIWADAVSKFNLTAPTINGSTYWVGDFGDFQSTVATGKISVVLLAIQRWSRETGFNLELTAYDNKGKKVAQGQANLGDVMDLAEFNELQKDSAPVSGEALITLSPDAEALIKSMPGMGGNGNQVKPMPSDLFQKITHPEQFEPLSLLISPELIRAAEIRKVNLVAVLPDTSFFGPLMGVGPKSEGISVNTLLKRLSVFTTKVDLKDNWLTVRPNSPNLARETRADRKELGAYLRRVATKRPLTLDEQAGFAISLPSQQDNYIPFQLASLFDSSRAYFDHETLRLYGLITREQRQQMISHGMPFENLNEKELEIVNKMVYGSSTRLQYQPQAEQGEMAPDVFDIFYNGIMREATESLPNGIPPKGLLKMQVDTSQVIKTSDVVTANYTMPGRTMDANTLAWQKYSQEHPELFPWMNEEAQKIDFRNLMFGTRTQVILTLEFTKSLSIVLSLEDNSAANFHSVALNDLPDDFKKQYQQSYDEYVKSYANAKPGQFTGNPRGYNPPPY